MLNRRQGGPSVSVQAMLREAWEDPAWWWIETILTDFAFLEREYTYRLDEIFLHFRGDAVRYRGPTWSVRAQYDPDGDYIGLNLMWTADLDRLRAIRMIDVPRLLASRAPDTDWLPTVPPPLNEALIRSMFHLWSEGLRSLCGDILAGDLPDDAAKLLSQSM